jgi:hypothetical protein
MNLILCLIICLATCGCGSLQDLRDSVSSATNAIPASPTVPSSNGPTVPSSDGSTLPPSDNPTVPSSDSPTVPQSHGPSSITLAWPILTPQGLTGEPGTLTIVGRMADGRRGILDWPAWDATTRTWRIGMMTPIPGSAPTLELHSGDLSTPIIYKQALP